MSSDAGAPSSPAPSPEDAAAVRAAEQARIRKERREAKIRAGGSARLNKISGLGGGIQRDAPPAPSSKADHADPAEVDISVAEHFYTPPRSSARTPPNSDAAAAAAEAQMRQLMMLGLDPRRAGSASTPPPPYPSAAAAAAAEEDPMMKLLTQMMGGAPGGAGPGGPGGSFNPFAAAGASGGFPGMPQQQQQQQAAAPVDAYSAIWRVLHLVVALGLGLYIALLTSFTGTKAARDQAVLLAGSAAGGDYSDADGEDERRHKFFYAFATAEAVLLTSRLFLDRSRAPPSGFLWTAAGVLPMPFKSYLETGLRYFQIFSTVRSDLLVCVFILGISSWIQAA